MDECACGCVRQTFAYRKFIDFHSAARFRLHIRIERVCLSISTMRREVSTNKMIDFFTILNDCGGKTLTCVHLSIIQLLLLLLLFQFILNSFSSGLNLIRNKM